MKYTIQHGSIAGIQHISAPDGVKMSAIYMSENRLPEAYMDGDMSKNIWEDLPKSVQASINRQFGIIFSLPYDKREGFIKSCIPFEIAA